MLSTSYNYLNFARVKDMNDLFKSNLPEIPKVKSLIDNSCLLFSLPSNKVLLNVAEGERVYRIDLLSLGVNKAIFGILFYVPLNRQLDIYTADDPTIPIIQFKNKKAVWKNFSTLLDRAGLERIFDKLSNII